MDSPLRPRSIQLDTNMESAMEGQAVREPFCYGRCFLVLYNCRRANHKEFLTLAVYTAPNISRANDHLSKDVFLVVHVDIRRTDGNNSSAASQTVVRYVPANSVVCYYFSSCDICVQAFERNGACNIEAFGCSLFGHRHWFRTTGTCHG